MAKYTHKKFTMREGKTRSISQSKLLGATTVGVEGRVEDELTIKMYKTRKETLHHESQHNSR